jgi:hypothetical protein
MPFESSPVSTDPKKPRGFCVQCGSIASTVAKFKIPGAIMVQRYCDKCLPKASFEYDMEQGVSDVD